MISIVSFIIPSFNCHFISILSPSHYQHRPQASALGCLSHHASFLIVTPYFFQLSAPLITLIDWCAFDYNALNHLTMFLFNCHLISNFATLSSPSPSSSTSQTSGVRRTDQNFDLRFSSIRFQVSIFGSNSLPNESRFFVDRSTTADHRKNIQ